MESPADSEVAEVKRQPANIFFRLSALATAFFVITIFAFVALTLSDSESPINRWLNRNLTSVMLYEVVGILTFAFIAMAVDRRQTRGKMLEQSAQSKSARRE